MGQAVAVFGAVKQCSLRVREGFAQDLASCYVGEKGLGEESPYRVQIIQETSDDRWEVEALYDLCFAPGREALSSYRLREGVDKVGKLCFVARDPDQILGGAIRFWPIRVGEHSALLLGPIAVHPTRQGEGLGNALIGHALSHTEALGWSRVLLVGDEPYYGRFGFHCLKTVKMPEPTNPDRTLGWGDWTGVSGLVVKAVP
jgi:predicted N-acetyltransferase YhbS